MDFRRNLRNTGTGRITSLPVHSSKIIVGRNDKAAAAAAQRSILPSGFLLSVDGIGAFIFYFEF